MESKINNLELWAYFFVWVYANIYSLHKLFEAQTNILESDKELFLRDLRPGWRIVSRPKDVSDIEWSTWKYFIQTSWHYLTIQFFISEIVRWANISFLKYWYILSSIFFVITFMGFRQLVILTAQPIIFAIIIFSGGRKTSIWIAGIFLLISYNSLKYKYFFWYFLDHDDLQDEEVYLILFAVAWIELRCISFCIDYVDKIEKMQKLKKTNYSLPIVSETMVNMLSYTFYLPLLYIGPMILYEDFEKSFSVTNEKLQLKLRRFLWDIFLFLTYSLFLDLTFHYIYFFAMQDNMEAMRKFPTLALCGGGLWMGLEFHMKYVISYGVSAAFARLDNMQPPPTPRCIARVHVYSQMWRYFDVGLYKFLVKYIYKPSFDTLSRYFVFPEITYKLMAAFATFAFIFMWHGTVWNIFVWSMLNYLGITLEHVGIALSKTVKYKWFKENILKTEGMETRFIALLCAPLLALSAISNFYLFAGTKIGNLYFEYFMQPSFLNWLIVSIALYSCCHVSMALKDVGSRTDFKIIVKDVK